MQKTMPEWYTHLEESNATDVARFLTSNSCLPGPRANLELLYSFAHMSSSDIRPGSLQVLCQWADCEDTSASEFLSMAALSALGACYVHCSSDKQLQVLSLLKKRASDPRWRVREAVAMAFQHILEAHFETAQLIFSEWLPRATQLEMRAVLAALAHPAVLTDEKRVTFCMLVTETALAALPDRVRGEDVRVLVQALSYVISVFCASSPRIGFNYMRKWAETGRPLVSRILLKNLGKARLKQYACEIRQIQNILRTH